MKALWPVAPVAIALVAGSCAPQPEERKLVASSGETAPADGTAPPAHPVDEPAPEARDAGADHAEVPLLPPVACGTALPGPAFRDDETEAAPGYAALVAATDLSSLPAHVDFSGNNVLQRIVVNYMLGTAGLSAVSRADAQAAGPLGTAVLVAAAHGTPGKVDFGVLRRGLAHFYPCSRPVPATLQDMRARYGDHTAWPQLTVDCSSAKNGMRRIYRDPGKGVFVAESVEKDGTVRETEVIFSKLRADGHLDFAVYMADGALSDRSTFASSRPEGITRSSPYFCVSCHMTPAAGTVSSSFPAGAAGKCE